MTMKFVEGVPLYRQEQHYARLGIELSRAVLSNWMLKGSGSGKSTLGKCLPCLITPPKQRTGLFWGYCF
jgi:ABC-type histidine transport system ATPase subunit